MSHTAVLLLGFQTIFQVKHRVYILITKFSLLKLYLRKRRKSFFFQETVVKDIKISCLVHTVKTASHRIFLLVCHIHIPKGLNLVYEIISHCIHPGKQGNVHKLKVK